MSRTPLRVVVVDDSAMMRLVVSSYLDDHDDLSVVQTCESSAAVVEAVAGDCPDVIVLDNQMPGGDGIDVLPELRARCPQAWIVMFSNDDDVHRRSLDLGANAFVRKDHPLEHLTEAILREA